MFTPEGLGSESEIDNGSEHSEQTIISDGIPDLVAPLEGVGDDFYEPPLPPPAEAGLAPANLPRQRLRRFARPNSVDRDLLDRSRSSPEGEVVRTSRNIREDRFARGFLEAVESDRCMRPKLLQRCGPFALVLPMPLAARSSSVLESAHLRLSSLRVTRRYVPYGAPSEEGGTRRSARLRG